MTNALDFYKKWLEMPQKLRNGTALLAVSGGVDSIIMADLFAKAGIPFAVAHCNFGLRGAESDGDEQFVQEFSASKNVAFHVACFDTKSISASSKKGIQETARNLRYDWLKELAAAHNYSCICTAHHQDDVAETVLMNLARGTGIAGLHGIRRVHGNILRPMLRYTKKELLGFAGETGIAYRNDASNESDDYTRNALRRHVLPLFEKFMPGASVRIAETANRLAEAEILYQRSIEAERKKLLQPRGKDFYIPLRLLRTRTPLSTILFELLQPFHFTAAQTEEVMHLMDSESGKKVASQTHFALRNRDFIILTKKETTLTDLIVIEQLPDTIQTPEGIINFTVSGSNAVIPDDANVCFADADKTAVPLILRRWKTGDYFYPLGMGGKKKKLSRFFIDQKIPLHEKEKIWVLESARRIVWVCGLRMDERFKATTGTKNILKIKLTTS